jgi:valyl-tRNA synthetase
LGQWPSEADADTTVLEMAAEVLSRIRREKTTAKRSQRSEVASLRVTDTADRIEALELAEGDLCDAGGVLSLATTVGTEPLVEVVLAEEA